MNHRTTPAMGRRDALPCTLALLVPLLLASACGADGVADDEMISTPDGAIAEASEALDGTSTCYTDGYRVTNVTFQIDPAMDAAPDSEDMDEKCRVWDLTLSSQDLEGRQIRVTANGRTGLCTVDGTGHDEPLGPGLVRMSTQGFQEKFGTTTSPQTGSFATYVDSCLWVTQQLATITSTPSSASGIGEFYSAPTNSPSSRRVAFTAPHGGGIETGTWEQVQHIHGLHADAAYFWLVRSSTGSPHSRWHITSDDLSVKSFSGLHRIAAGFSAGNGEQVRDQVVGFHGYNPNNYSNCSAEVLIGGLAPLPLRQGLESAAELWADYRGVTIDALADFAGTNCPRGVASANYANELSDFSEGIHLEQSLDFKGNTAKRNALAEAVARYVLAYNSVASVALGQQATSAQASTDVGLGASWSVSNGTRVGSGDDYGTCGSSDDRGHVDWFVRQGTVLSRIGGGGLICNASDRFVPEAGFQAVDYTNATGAPVKVRVVGVAYTKNTSGANIQLGATLSAQ